jgi:L-asparagine transporter-like permease
MNWLRNPRGLLAVLVVVVVAVVVFRLVFSLLVLGALVVLALVLISAWGLRQRNRPPAQPPVPPLV